MTDMLQIERQGRVAHLRLNRPAAHNAIDRTVCQQLIQDLDRLEADGAVGALVLSGNGERAFSAGADLKLMRTLDAPDLRRFIELTWAAFDRLAMSPIPSVAALHGYVLGGGLELALACDLRVADSTVEIGLPEMTLGSVPGSGAMQRLPPLVGPARLKEMVLLGRRFRAEEAAAVGLVNRAVARGEAVGVAMEWAAAMAERPREAVRYAKLALGIPAATAAGFHGLVSEACHRDRAYQDRTDRFARRDGNNGG